MTKQKQAVAEETGEYNYFRDYDPAIGRYVQSDPIGLKAGTRNTYWYANGRPMNFIDTQGLKAEMCARPLLIFPFAGKHCYVRFNGDDGDSMSYDPGGVGPDPAPKWFPKTCTPVRGPDDDDCVKTEMKKCKAADYDLTGNNCCHCAEQAFKRCGMGIPRDRWPNWPINPGP